MADNACTRCGACCASFHVDFAREELQSEGGAVPDGLAVDVNDTLCLTEIGRTFHPIDKCDYLGPGMYRKFFCSWPSALSAPDETASCASANAIVSLAKARRVLR